MLHDDYQEKIDRFAWGIIHRKVKQLIGKDGFTKQDRDDLQQELILRLLQALPSFDSGKAHRNKFITTVVERYVANILRDKKAEKRDDRRVSSLNMMIDSPNDGPTELSQTIGKQELDARRNRYPQSDEERAHFVQDVAEVMAKLPNELCELAERLKTQTVSEIARDMGIPRTTLNESVRRLRRRFESASLKDYL